MQINYNKAFENMKKNEFIEANIPLVHWFLNTHFVNIEIQLNESADDVAQDLFVKLFLAYDRYDLNKKIRWTTFAVTVMRNELLMKLRKKRNKDKYGFVSSLSDVVAEDERDALTIEDTLGYLDEGIEEINNSDYIEQFQKQFKESLTKTEAKYLKAIRVSDGFTHKDIGKKIKISQAYVSRVRSNIIKKGQKILSDMKQTPIERE